MANSTEIASVFVEKVDSAAGRTLKTFIKALETLETVGGKMARKDATKTKAAQTNIAVWRVSNLRLL